MRPTKLAVAIALIAALALVRPGRAAVVEVDQSGAGDFLTIQEGLDAAAAGDTVLVHPGVYSGPQNRGLRFIENDIVLLSEAGVGSTVIDCEAEDQAFRFRPDGALTAHVEGFTVRNGREDFGGGAECVGSSPVFVRCVFEDCDAPSWGGAVYCRESSAAFEECSFSNNRASRGGAIYCEESPIRIRACTFLWNSVTRWGGAVYADCSGVVIDSSHFGGNSADGWGGAVWSIDGADTIRACEFDRNMSFEDDGGALVCRMSPLFVADCVFRDNAAGDDGGAVVFWECEPYMTGCLFERNFAESVGGAILYSQGHGALVDCTFVGNDAGHGGAVHLYESSPFVQGCLFEANEASNGGAVYAEYDCAPSFEGCTFTENTAGYDGGGLYIDRSSITMTMCTLAGNAADDDGGGIRFHIGSGTVTNTVIAFSSDGEGAMCHGTEQPSFYHCCVFGNAGGDSLCGDHSENLFVNPGFCDPPFGDLSLRSDSACLPGGNPWGEAIGSHGWGCEGDPYLRDGCMVDGAIAPWETAAAILVELPRITEVTVRVFDFRGRLVASPFESVVLPSGVNLISWDLRNDEGRRVASGTYFCVVEAGGSTHRRKIAVVSGMGDGNGADQR